MHNITIYYLSYYTYTYIFCTSSCGASNQNLALILVRRFESYLVARPSHWNSSIRFSVILPNTRRACPPAVNLVWGVFEIKKTEIVRGMPIFTVLRRTCVLPYCSSVYRYFEFTFFSLRTPTCVRTAFLSFIIPPLALLCGLGSFFGEIMQRRRLSAARSFLFLFFFLINDERLQRPLCAVAPFCACPPNEIFRCERRDSNLFLTSSSHTKRATRRR